MGTEGIILEQGQFNPFSLNHIRKYIYFSYFKLNLLHEGIVLELCMSGKKCAEFISPQCAENWMKISFLELKL